MDRLDVKVLCRRELQQCSYWSAAFARQRKDRRFFELVEDTIDQTFDYRYFAIVDESGHVRAVQPFLIIDQDLLAGMPNRVTAWVGIVRRLWPRFLRLRTLMVGCAVGEGHLDGTDEEARSAAARALAAGVLGHARALGAPLVVLKEFPACYRATLKWFLDNGFARSPSMPMVSRNIEFRNFDDYAQRTLSKDMRYKLRRKFREAAQAGPIEMSQVADVTPFIEDIYPLYLQVYERSDLRFEKLTKEFFCGLGQRMPDKARFFLWRHRNRIVAFNVCMVQDDAIYSECIGLDYAVALDLHLYFVVMRDVMSWAMANGYKSYHSSALNYDPKYRLRFVLEPLDLYVRHTSRLINFCLARLAPLLGPTRYDKNLERFPNFHELHG
jgi:Acetyltransferase (GNAT) domain